MAKEQRQPVQVNDLLHEIPQLVEEMRTLEDRRGRQRTQIRRMEGRLNSITGDLLTLSARVEALTRAADALHPDRYNDWREWPWVKEAGIDKMVPKRERTRDDAHPTG
jgi:chromosome segregation ATPase